MVNGFLNTGLLSTFNTLMCKGNPKREDIAYYPNLVMANHLLRETVFDVCSLILCYSFYSGSNFRCYGSAIQKEWSLALKVI